MKRYTWLLLLAALPLGQGCFGTEKMFDDRSAVVFEEAQLAPAPVPPTAVVSPDDVTPENAAQVAQSLGAELDRAANEPVAQPVTAHIQPK